MKKEGKTLILCEVFYPEDFIINDLARQWQKEKKDFEVLTRTPSYPFGKVFDGYKNRVYHTTELGSVKVHRVPVLQGYQKSMTIKILNYFMFVFWSTLVALFIGRKFNKVFIYQTGPLTLATAGIILKKIYKADVTIWTQDLWPETVFACGVKKTKLISVPLDNFVKWVYKNCDNILISCEGFAERIHKFVPEKNLTFVPNWSLMKYEPKKEVELPGEHNFTFAGNIGKVQNLDNIVRGFNYFVKENPSSYLNIIGDGSYLNELKEIVEQEKIPNVNFTGRIPLKDMSDYYKASDVLIISLVDVPLYERMIPSKFQAYLTTAKPIYSIFKGEVSHIVDKYEIGYTAHPSDVEDIAQGFSKFKELSEEELSIISERSQYLSDSVFNRERIISNINNNVWTN
ncbi:glycosyltransferase family 4 protein [Bacteroides sedimenti]|uniref:Glycosyltransferase WbuB n=1 Tax=Bacteroides sedimenti TaxID=2136147 RepID=A0ABM8I8S2_9BACE